MKSIKPVSVLTEQNRLLYTGDSALDEDIDDVISSSFFLCILNSDGIVQNGNYLFNVNLASERCYVMHSSFISNNLTNANYLALLNEDTTNTNLFNFSTSDDLLDDLEDMGYPVTPSQMPPVYAKRCKDGGASREKDEGNEYYTEIPIHPQIRLKTKLAYQKAGIWFGLVAKMEYQHKALIGWRTSDLQTWEAMQALSATSRFKYKPKCGTEVNLNAGWIGSKGGNTFKEKPYEGTRGMNKYDMQYQFEVAGGVPTGYVTKTTRIYRIVSGY